jgi:hypothetical protein
MFGLPVADTVNPARGVTRRVRVEIPALWDNAEKGLVKLNDHTKGKVGQRE